MMYRRVLAVLALSVVLPSAAFAEEAAHHADAGVPQFDPTYFASQIFWLLISGVLMYALMAKVIIPRVGRMIDLRDDQVRHDLETAARLRQESEDVKVEYMLALRDADERAKSLVQRVTREITAKQDAALEEAANKISARLNETEQTLRVQKDEVIKNIPQMSDRFSTMIVQEMTKKAA